MTTTRRRSLIVFATAVGAAGVMWWSWPKVPTVTFVRFDQASYGRLVLRITNQTDTTYYFTGDGAHRISVDSGWKTKRSGIVQPISGFVSDSLPPGNEAELTIQMNNADGTPIVGSFHTGIELLRPPSHFWRYVSSALGNLLPSILHKRRFSCTNTITP